MSLLGSLNAAVGGMNAQSAFIGNISDNIANSQTVGFKETDTKFVDYLTESSPSTHSPGAVVARPQYTNSTQGAVTQVSNPTSIAISGQGFFAVQRPTGNGTVSPQPYFTRAGNFAPNSLGQLVNSTGYILDGWKASTTPTGTTYDSSKLQPIVINKGPSLPVPTSQVTLAANLPASSTATFPSTIQAFDAAGGSQAIALEWSPITGTPGAWNLSVNGTAMATAQFGTGPAGTPPATGGNGSAAGSLVSIAGTGGATATGTTLSTKLNFGLGEQDVNLNLSGMTQFAASDYQVSSLAQDGSAQGNYSSVSIGASGDVSINYDNGTNTIIAKVPLVNFNDPNALQQQDGQAFTATLDSGLPSAHASGVGGAGKLIVGAEEASNVDIAAQFTQMIVAQQTYTANTKVIATTNNLLQDTLDMVRG